MPRAWIHSWKKITGEFDMQCRHCKMKVITRYYGPGTGFPSDRVCDGPAKRKKSTRPTAS